MNCGLRVVFDTGTLIGAAIRPTSDAERALSLALREGVVCACDASLEQLRSCLGKSRLDRYMSRRARAAFFEMFRRNAWICQVSASDIDKVRRACRDRKNIVVLALARAAEADVVVSVDRDLLTRKTWHGIRIVTPADFAGRFDPKSARVSLWPPSLQFS